MVKGLIELILCVIFLISISGCQEEECTPHQHFEIMREIRASQEEICNNLPPLALFVGRLDYVLQIGFSKKPVREYIIRCVKRICNRQGVSYRAFDRAHQKYGLLELSYTEEITIDINERWKNRNRVGLWDYLDIKGRTITSEDLHYDLGLDYHSGLIIIIIDKDGNTVIDGLAIEGAELDTLLKNHYCSSGAVVWHIKTHPQVKTKHVFDLMDDIFVIMLADSLREIGPVSGMFTFSESTDITSDRLKRLVSSEFSNPGIYTFLKVDFVIHIAESDEIFLNGERQSSIEELVNHLKDSIDSKKDVVHVVVDDEVLWSKALEIGRRLRDKGLWIHGNFYRSKYLAEMQSARRGTQ
ncbi:MAG: hypothetical protein E3J71_08650 [Candidatus Stahlbacteria bacterium]|nr:MAG: hypothetical protein E3J71_08650 [Candidatus Stahlbacteria bacterium]